MPTNSAVDEKAPSLPHGTHRQSADYDCCKRFRQRMVCCRAIPVELWVLGKTSLPETRNLRSDLNAERKE